MYAPWCAHDQYLPQQQSSLSHLDGLIGPVDDPGEQPAVDGPAERVPGGRGLARAEVGHQDLSSSSDAGGGGGHGAARQAVVQLLHVALEGLARVVQL